MRALLVTHVFPPTTGGSGRWFWEIYSRLSREQVAIAAGDHPGAKEFDAKTSLVIQRLQLSLSSWGMANYSGLKGYWRAFREVKKLIREHEVSLLHCGACLPDGWIGYLCKKLLGMPYIVYMHGEELCYAGSSRELGWMCRKVLSSAEFVVANSQNTRRILMEKWHFPDTRIEVLTPGVDCERFRPAPRDEQVRGELGWGDRKVVLTVGRLQKRKGHDAMIRAIPRIKERVPNVLYSIAGGGEERSRLETLASELSLQDHVQFRGDTSDAELAACYQQCDLFALPNRQIGDDLEGFGMVLVEAQASGKPVLAGHTGGTSETMTEATGITLDCDDVDRLSGTVAELLLDEARRGRMGKAARQHVETRFDWAVLTQRASELLLPSSRDDGEQRSGPSLVTCQPKATNAT